MKWSTFKDGLYEYYCTHSKLPKTRQEFDKEIVEYKSRNDKYLVYLGYSRKDREHLRILYVGTTIQHPMSRWFYHSTHGKNLDFVEAYRFENEDDMLNKEFELIQLYKPSLNKITKRRQNYNVTLSQEELEKRKGDPQWCQCCLRRHVTSGYKYCYYCQTLK